MSTLAEFLHQLAEVTMTDTEPEARVPELFRHEMAGQLKAMRAECKSWLSSSPRLQGWIL
jgi:hypothetical protein